MTENEKTEAEETYLNEHFGEGLLGVSPEQVHDFVGSQATAGGGDPGSSHVPTEHDYVKELNEEVGPEAVGKVAEEAFTHVTEIPLAGPIGHIVSGVLEMKGDQPEVTDEQRREYDERTAKEAQENADRQDWETQHPEMHDEPDASVGDATTQ